MNNNNFIVSDVMLDLNNFPIVSTSDFLKDSIELMDKYRLGIICIVDHANVLQGIMTDGDLRRALNKKVDLLEVPISQLMSKKAKTITYSSLATEAIKVMQENQIYSLVVVDKKKQPIGLIRMHDLVEAGLV